MVALGVAAGAAALLGVIIGVRLSGRRALREQALTDPLTGAFNRRHLDLCLAHAIQRLRRTGEAASILMIDVDHFKAINDTQGHPAGDAVLCALVAMIKARARKMDVLFRTGGDEFVLLLPGTDRAGAIAIADTLRAQAASAAPAGAGRIAISIGVTELHDAHSAAGWMEDADTALYRAKRGGRNRVAASASVKHPPAWRAASR